MDDVARGQLALKEFVLRIDPSQVFFLKFILEGYDNLFIMSTLERRQGVMLIRAARGSEDDLLHILHALKEKIGLECVEEA